MEGIQIKVEKAPFRPEISVVKIAGYIDTTTAPELERVIRDLLHDEQYKMVIDLEPVEYISSAGWGIFISEIKNIRVHQGDLKLAGMRESVLEVYELLEFSTILSSAKSVASAIELFAAEPAAAPKPGGAKPASPAPKASAASPSPVPRSVPSAPTPVPAAPTAAPAPVQPVPVAVPAANVPQPTPVPPPAPAPEKPFTFADRVLTVVKVHPTWGAWAVKKELNRIRGKNPKVSWGDVKREFKAAKLHRRSARIKFSQQA